MKILIIGNDPRQIGGVVNYTRPLAFKYAELGHEVFYLFSGASLSKYDLNIMPYIKTHRSLFPFECAEIINSECLPFNYGYPLLDMSSPRMDDIFTHYIKNINPDVVHIHSRFGLPASINEIAHNFGCVVVNTIHVYGYICQKRVMIDHFGEPCPGPDDLFKCAACTGTLNYNKERLRALVINYKETLKAALPVFYSKLQLIKKELKFNKEKPAVCEARTQLKNNENGNYKQLAEKLDERLRYCARSLNEFSDCTICVSNDVKRTLMRYGLNECSLHVQHIGSIIAEKQFQNKKEVNDPIVIGNIGGVNYYKGTHVLLDAISKVKHKNFTLKIFGRYDQKYINGLNDKINTLPVKFTGSYKPDDLPEILNQIDIMVLPSICNDTAPQTIFESFSGGVPIISSNIGGFPDFVQHDHNGLLFEAGSSDDLAQKIDYVLNKPERINEYKKNIPKLKTITENAQELIELYHTLMHERKG